MTGNQCSVCSGWQSPTCLWSVFYFPIRREAACCVICTSAIWETNWLSREPSSKTEGRGERLTAYYLFMEACHIEKDLPGYINKIKTFGQSICSCVGLVINTIDLMYSFSKHCFFSPVPCLCLPCFCSIRWVWKFAVTEGVFRSLTCIKATI